MTVDLKSMAHEARQAALLLRTFPREVKDRVLNLLAVKLIEEQDAIIAANARDLLQAEAAGLAPAMVDRLRLDSGRLAGIAADLRKVTELDDPVGEVFDEHVMPNGLQVHKVRVPIGVLAVIYESRPNVTIDVTGLALKSGNAVILRGGSETLHSNRALVAVIRAALAESGLPQGAVQ